MFGFSVGLTLVSIGWMMRFFRSRPRAQTAVAGVMSGALLLEIAIIAVQRVRGVPSHFNMATTLDGVLWSMMGLAISVFALLAMVLAVWSFGRLEAPPVMRTGIRAALVLLVFSQISGQLIVLHGTSVVWPEGKFVAAEIARAGTYGAAGNLKLPHAIALHGLQLLPLLGALAVRLNWSPLAGRFWIALAGVGFFGVALTTQLQAYTGRAMADLDPVLASALGVCLVAFGLPWAHAACSWLTATIDRRASTKSALAHP